MEGIFFFVFVGILIIGLIFSIFFLIVFAWFKNNNTFKNQTIITNAIYEYKLDKILHSESILVNYDDMEPYEWNTAGGYKWRYKDDQD